MLASQNDSLRAADTGLNRAPALQPSAGAIDC